MPQRGNRLADAADRADTGRVRGQPTLRGTVELVQLDVEAPAEFTPDRGRHPGGDDAAHRVVGVVRPGRLGVDGRGHAAQQREIGAAVPAGDVPQPRLREAPRQHAGNGVDQRGAERDHLRVGVGQRQSGIEAIVRPEAEQERRDLGSLAIAPVRQHDALRIAGGARGVDQLHRAVGIRAREFLVAEFATGHCAVRAHADGLQLGRGRLAFVGRQADHPLQARHPLTHRQQFGQRVVAGNDAPAADGAQHEDEPVAPGARVDRHDGDAEQRAGHHQVDELGMVGEQACRPCRQA